MREREGRSTFDLRFGYGVLPETTSSQGNKNEGQTMKTMTLAAFQAALTRAGQLKGEAGIITQKKLIMDGYMITDADGMAVDPDSVDVVIAASSMEDPQDEKATEPMTDESMTKKVKSAIAAEFASMRIPVVTANHTPAPWETANPYSRLKVFKSKETAYRFGSFVLAAGGHKKAAQFCANNGMILKAHNESSNTQGGFLVPDEFESELITLRESFGVFRANAKVYPMKGDTLRIAKRQNGLTAYWAGEMTAGTESTQTFDSIGLVAKKLFCLTTISNELLEDATMNIGDDIALEMAYQFSFKEDQAGFLGDGTSTYGGVVGLDAALTDATYQVSDGAGTTFAAVTKAEISAGFAKLPAWAWQRDNVKIYCHKSVYHNVFESLAMAVGGATATELSNGIAPRYLGIPVVYCQAMPFAAGAAATYAFIGDLAQACILGDRRSTTIAFSDSALNTFEQDERAIRGTERLDIQCANVGGSTASGAMIKMTL